MVRSNRSRGYRRRAAGGSRRYSRLSPAHFIVASVVIAALILGVRAIYLQGYSPGFASGVTVNGTSLYGYSLEDGKALIERQAQERLHESSYQITFEDMEWTFTAGMLGAQMDATVAIERAWNFGHIGSWWERRAQMQSLKDTPFDLKAEITYDETALDAFIEEIRSAIDIAAVDSIARPNTSETLTFEIVRDKQGRKLDTAALKALLIDTILEGNDPVIDLNARGLVKIVEPNRTADQVGQSLEERGTATTSFKGSPANRIKNIKRALEPFNGLKVEHGQAVSFNATTGKRTIENGFYEAKEYLNGASVTGVGGGTCQASTTLYQALRLADIQVDQRHNHGMAVSYAEPSMDAAVLDTGKVKDLVFTNLTGAPIYIHTEVTNTKATVTIYGEPMDYTVELVSVVVSTRKQGKEKKKDVKGKYVKYTDEEYLFERGYPSMRSRLERVYRDANGVEFRREVSGEDYYGPKRDKVYVGIIDRETGLVVD